MTADQVQSLIDDATYEFTMGNNDVALAKLAEATAALPTSFEAWHALAEIQFSLRHFPEALAAAEKAHALRSDDVFINTTLSRIWMELGYKNTAEKFGAHAKILGWKDQLKNPADYQGGVA